MIKVSALLLLQIFGQWTAFPNPAMLQSIYLVKGSRLQCVYKKANNIDLKHVTNHPNPVYLLVTVIGFSKLF